MPIDDIQESKVQLFVLKIDNHIIGVIGLEQYKEVALLRSLAVQDRYKNQKIGRNLIGYLLRYCNDYKVQQLYLLTATAEKYFEKFNFYKVQRENIPDRIKNTKEFSSICPVTAVVMRKDLKH